ncbi:MAG: cytochrome c biogenesis protein CcsA [Cellvibrionaceae bacterium]
MSFVTIVNIIAIALYLLATGYLLVQFSRQRSLQQKPQTFLIVGCSVLALTAHAIGLEQTVFVNHVGLNQGATTGIDAGLFKLPTLFFWLINLIVLISGLKKPLHNLFIFLFPLSSIAILVSHIGDSRIVSASPAVGHIFIALLASGFLTIATLQALALAYQDHQLKHKNTSGIIKLLPPLQTMESLMFQLLWIGEVLLTILIVSGILIIDDISAQKQAHTLIFSLLAWLIYAVLLWGRHWLGWRGNIAIRWTLGGFVLLMLAYVGTQMVYQVILG